MGPVQIILIVLMGFCLVASLALIITGIVADQPSVGPLFGSKANDYYSSNWFFGCGCFASCCCFLFLGLFIALALIPQGEEFQAGIEKSLKRKPQWE